MIEDKWEELYQKERQLQMKLEELEDHRRYIKRTLEEYEDYLGRQHFLQNQLSFHLHNSRYQNQIMDNYEQNSKIGLNAYYRLEDLRSEELKEMYQIEDDMAEARRLRIAEEEKSEY